MPTRLSHPTGTQRQDRQHGWGLPWSLAAVLALGLALASPSPGQAKTFRCDAEDVQCLIDAINEANTNGHKNTIRLAAGTYPLTTVDNHTDGPNGLPSITGRIILRGMGTATTRLERVVTGDVLPCHGDPAFRILHVAPTGVLTLDGLTIRGGCSADLFSGGGGLFNQGKTTVIKTAVVENTVDDNVEGGGGIANRGRLTVIQSTILRNSAVLAGGGGIANAGTLTITDSTIADNDAAGSAGGGLISRDGMLTVTRSLIAHNTSEDAGGILARGPTVITVITHSSILDNHALATGGIRNARGGTMHITDSTIARNVDFGSCFGAGGIENTDPGSTLTIRNKYLDRSFLPSPLI